MTSPEKIVAQFLQVRKFNKQAYENGWVTLEEYEKAQRDVVFDYADWLSAGDEEQRPYAILTLLDRDAQQKRLEEVIKDNMYQAVSIN